jgi:hypothetical protein
MKFPVFGRKWDPAGGLENGAVSFDPGIVLETGTTLVRQWRPDRQRG